MYINKYALFIFFLIYPFFVYGDLLRLEININKSQNIDIELLNELAPNHVERIIKLANEGKYDGVAFHRVIEGFMAQTGDVEFGNVKSFDNSQVGKGGSKYKDLKPEFSSLNFVKGIVGMARSRKIDSANSQFFIMYEDASWLDSKYTIFGKVINGIEILNDLKKGSRKDNGLVKDPDFIVKARIIKN